MTEATAARGCASRWLDELTETIRQCDRRAGHPEVLHHSPGAFTPRARQLLRSDAVWGDKDAIDPGGPAVQTPR